MPMITSDLGSVTSVSPFIRATQDYPQNVFMMSESAFSHAPPQLASRVLGRFAADAAGRWWSTRSFSTTVGSLVLILFDSLMINRPESIRGGWKD